MKKMNGIMEYHLKLKKDQQIASLSEGIGTQWLLNFCDVIVKEGAFQRIGSEV